MAPRPACALGRLEPDGPWIGFVLERGAARLVIGLGDGELRSALATRDQLLAAAIAYFSDLFPDPPQELEATHGDVADLMRLLAGAADDGAQRAALIEALDAIDDGLAADAVVSRLMEARRLAAHDAPDPQDPGDVLRAAAREIRRD